MALSHADPGDLESLPIPSPGGAVPLASLATIQTRRKPGAAEVRFQGKPARALFVWRASDAPPLSVDRALRERIASLPGGVRGAVGWSEAEPLRELLQRLVLAGLLAVALGAAAGAVLAGRWGALALGLAVPAAVAAAANGFLLAGIPLNVTTLTALAVAAGAALPLAALRLVRRDSFWTWGLTAMAAAATVPVAVALGSAELGPLLSEPALALLIATAAGVLAVAVLPGADFAAGTKDNKDTKDLKDGQTPVLSSLVSLVSLIQSTLRDSGTTVLIAATAAYVALALFGGALVPRPGRLEPDEGNLNLRLRLPQGTTLEETVQRLRKIEEPLAKAAEVERFWSVATPGSAIAVAELRTDARNPGAIRLLTTRLRYEMADGGSVEIDSGAAPFGDCAGRAWRGPAGRPGGPRRDGRGDHDLQGRPARRRPRGRADRLRPPASASGHAQGAAPLDLRLGRPDDPPRPASASGHAPRLGGSGSPAACAGPARRRPRSPCPAACRAEPLTYLTAVPAGAPEDPDRAVPQIAELLGRPLRLGDRIEVPGWSLEPTEEILFPRVLRQSGRFVVPVEIRIPGFVEEVRKARRKEIDRSLGQLAAPRGLRPGAARPGLAALADRDRLRLLALGLAVPLLLFAVAACRLGSLSRGLAALAPLAAGLLAALPFVGWSLGQQDELTAFALAAALALALPSAAEAAAAPAVRGAGLYRALRHQAPWLLAAAPVLVLALAAATLGLEPAAAPLGRAPAGRGRGGRRRPRWPRRSWSPALLLAGTRWRERDPEEIAAQAPAARLGRAGRAHPGGARA